MDSQRNMRVASERGREYWQRVDEIFNAVVEVGPAERTAHLEALCGSDRNLRMDVDRLLACDDRMEGGFLESPVALSPQSSNGDAASGILCQPDTSAAQRWIGRRIGRFTLTRCIGVGGMGAVYEATQDRPRRTVALKLILGAMASPQRLRRFVAETDILASLHHPNIAQVFEAGTGDDGPDAVPYMAMELIPDAATITQWVAARRLDRRARLSLFLQVCDAVSYLHQRGVIHRDLKPANILVDAPGRPRVIDFGVARLVATDSALTRVTDAKQLVGTLAYMSPEQVCGDGSDVDTRCDVYALGVVLFELLTGRLPFDVRSDNLPDAIRAIESGAPPRPSSFDRSLRGDLETIVLKAMDKDRERRYASAADLGRDLRRFLDGRPIEARPAGTAYQMRKLVFRHKGVFAALSTLFVALCAFSVAMTVLYGRAEGNRRRAETAERSAQQRAETATRVSTYLLRQLVPPDGMGTPGLLNPEGGAFTAAEFLDREAHRIRTELSNEPSMQATLLMMVGLGYVQQELFQRAVESHSTALEICLRTGDDELARAEHQRCLGEALRRKGQLDAAEPLLRQALETLRSHAGEAHVGLRAAILSMANLHCERREFQAAIELLRDENQHRANQFGANDYDVMPALAQTYLASGDLPAAEQLYREILAEYRRQFGHGDARTLFVVNGLARTLRDRNDLAGAEAACQEALGLCRAALGDEHPDVAAGLRSIAMLRMTAGAHAEANPLLRRSLEIYRKRLGENHTGVGSALQNLAELALITRRAEDLEWLDEQAQALHQRSQSLPEDHLHRSGCLLLQGTLRLARGDASGSEPMLREAAQRRRTVLSPTHWLTAYAESFLGICLSQQGRFDEAAPLLVAGYPRIAMQFGRNDPRSQRTLRAVIEACEATSQPAEAQRYRAMLMTGPP